MHTIDFIVLISTLLFIVIYGYYKTRGSKDVNDYLKGGNEAKWWTVGLSVMATQASAITFLSTPGQAFHSGMSFVQFYIGVPIAMVVISMVFIPIYHRLKVYTAYEFLESRFDLKTRSLTAILFLIQRGLAAGITIFAPSIILSAVLGWDLFTLNIMIGILVIIYTVSGGTKAVSITQKQQMGIIFLGMFLAFLFILKYLPEEIDFNNALEIANVHGKLNILDFNFDFENNYTIWSGLLGGTFLALSYFGTDQSQVQRYLSGRSLRESQLGLIFNGFLKVPMQFFILLVGVFVFVFYQFNASPLNFNPVTNEVIQKAGGQERTIYQDYKNQLIDLQERKAALTLEFSQAEVKAQEAYKTQLIELATKEREIRESASKLIDKVDPQVETNDEDYVFIHFILNELPRGLIGLLLAVILCAAMSSTASELNALATTTVIDIYKRNQKSERTEEHYLSASKYFTLAWGFLAIVIACTANLFENLIELVNIIGSIFYGNVLGIFLIAFFIKFIKSNAIFMAAIITQLIIIAVWWSDKVPYLWLNILGCVIVILLAIILQLSTKKGA